MAGKGVGEQIAFRRELVEIWRCGRSVTITAQLRAVIFTRNPENIRAKLFLGGSAHCEANRDYRPQADHARRWTNERQHAETPV